MTVKRRRFLKRSALACLGIGGTGLVVGADALVVEPRWIGVERLDVPIRGLGAAPDGLRVALISDTHCGPWTGPAYVRKAVRLANAQEPDVVLLLGDYVHRDRRRIAPGIAPFADLRAEHGVFAVLGNHDHWEDAPATRQALADADIPELDSSSVTLDVGGSRLAIGGVDDLWTAGQDLEATFDGVPDDVPRLLMSHNPDYAESLPEGLRVDLMVSGHTHGGQVWLPLVGAPLVPSRFGQKYRAGLVRGPRCPVYVTRGLGTITPPVRFFCRPELTVLTLRRGT